MTDALYGGMLDYQQFRKLFPAIRSMQRFDSNQRANMMASHRLGYQQKEAVGSFFYTHELCPDVAFDTAKQATTRAFGIYQSQFALNG